LMRSESERAADDVVISAGMPAVEYADHLLALANGSAFKNRAPLAAIGMAHRTQLETRLRAMLNTRQPRRIMNRTTQHVVGIAALFAIVPLAGLQARVQDSRQVQPPTKKKIPPVAVPKNAAPTVALPTLATPMVVPPTRATPMVAPPSGATPTVVPSTRATPPVAAPPTFVSLVIIEQVPSGPPTVQTPPATRPPTPVDASSAALSMPTASATVDKWIESIRKLKVATPKSRVDTLIEAEIRAVPGEELNIDLMSGGNITVHGWDQPTARLRARIVGNYWRETIVAFQRYTKGIDLVTMAEVNGARLIGTPPSDSLSSGRIQIRYRTNLLPPVTLENDFELWVPKQTNIKFKSWGGDFTLHELEGTFTGDTRIGNIKATNSRGGASLSTSNGNLTVTSSSLTGGMTTQCGSVALSQVTGGLNAKTMFDPSGAPDLSGDARTPLIIIDGMPANDYCLLKARGGGSSEPGRANENYPYGDIVRDSVLLGGSLSTRSGSIKIGVANGVLTATTSNGNVEIGQLTGDATMVASHGNVSARIVNLTGTTHYITARANGGNVTLELPDSLDAVVDVEAGYTTAFSERTKRSPTIASDIPLLRSETTRGATNYPILARTLVHGTTTLGNGRGRILIRV
ncbi:MAG: hypothetical protein ABI852_21310, partial [Gemmatimonadaceae bacterium]